MQVPEVSYNCRLRSETAGQKQGDADVNLLLACKLQLSSEVIKWKTENLRLQKECENIHNQNKELGEKVSKLADESKDLKLRLTQVEEENKLLRNKNIQINEERLNSIHKITQSLDKYHSFPTVSSEVNYSLPKFSGCKVSEPVDQKYPEDWREVSERLMKQMQQEMKEVHDMNWIGGILGEKDLTDIDADSQDLDKDVSVLASNTLAVKNKLLEQRKNLLSILGSIDKSPKRKDFLRKKHSDSLPVSASRNYTDSHRMSRDHLTEQLECLSELHIAKETNVWNIEDDLTLEPGQCSGEQHTASSHHVDENSVQVIEDRVCPFCQQQFAANVPQVEYENHVFEHLDADSASLLEKEYVVI